MRKVVLVGLIAGLLFDMGRAEDAPPKKVQDTAQVTFLSANGNTKSTTVGASNELKVNWAKAALEVNAGALGAQTQQVTTAEKYFANEKLQRNFDARNYVFEKVGWDKDRFAGVANRIDSSAGV